MIKELSNPNLPNQIQFIVVGGSSYENEIPGAPFYSIFSNWTYKKYWKHAQSTMPTTALVVAFGEGTEQKFHTIMLGPSFFAGDSKIHQDATLIHEYMHIINLMNDVHLAEKWKSEGAIGMDTSSPAAASSSIFNFIFGGCPNTKPK